MAHALFRADSDSSIDDLPLGHVLAGKQRHYSSLEGIWTTLWLIDYIQLPPIYRVVFSIPIQPIKAKGPDCQTFRPDPYAAAITIAGVEQLHSIHKDQFALNPIRIAVRDLLIPSTVLATLCGGASAFHAQSIKPSTLFAVSTPSGLANSLNKPKLSVDYVAGKLVVTATNASLNQILRQVSRSIGLKITGSVADQPVYGQYGPSTPSIVLSALLDGTGINMLLVNDAKGPTELILTPRHGGPTPPSLSASRPEPEEHPAPEAPQRQPATEKPPTAPPTTPRRGFGRHSAQGAPSDANAGDYSSWN